MDAMLESLPQTDEARWRAVLDHDSACDGAFVYAVRSTGIYCRPSCPSRRPGRAQVAFFALPEGAERAGFRACRRCRPRAAEPRDATLAVVRAACRYIDEESETPPTLEALAGHVGLSPSHLQRQFKRVMGISPRQYADARRLERFRRAVRGGDDVTGAMYEAGYGSSSRLYERAASQLGMTPATYGKGGAGAHIRYAVAASPFGRLLVAATAKGVCFLAFGDDDAELARVLAREFPAAEIGRDEAGLAGWVEAVLEHLAGSEPHPALPLDIRATAFQRQVWEALSRIPAGETRSYGEIAADIGRPGAQRAVGRACGSNPVPVLIPCHRAVRGDGGLGGYRWGTGRKEALLRSEGARESDAS